MFRYLVFASPAQIFLIVCLCCFEGANCVLLFLTTKLKLIWFLSFGGFNLEGEPHVRVSVLSILRFWRRTTGTTKPVTQISYSNWVTNKPLG